ncbi:MAG: glycoside hydrolase family 127 protein [Bryobacteraceae bacterium]|nr:glycoside hydrolase family 127 protein [Bryobacteraceae bacterium]
MPVRAARLEAGFWKARQDVTIERSLPTLLELLEQHGVVDNFRRLARADRQPPRRGPLYTDSDLYKWMEAAAWSLQVRPDAKLEAKLDELTDIILAAQEPSGYLNTWFVDERAPLRWQQQTSGHELYCLGHLLQAGIAYYRSTGKRKLLDGGIRFVEYLLRDFGPAPKQPLLTGHPELELALAELYRTSGDRRYLDLAAYLFSGVERERLKLRERDLVYLFSGKPFPERTQLEGHAVRALYASTGAADYVLETGDAAFRRTVLRLWEDLAFRKVYVTGGAGARAAGETFGDAYELPNQQAYSESCAAIAGMIFSQRMLHLTGEARYAELMERALYNGICSGMSSSGTLYCYRNPLAAPASDRIRNPWYDTTCCPPNLQRTFTALGAYFFSTSREGIWVHFYDNAALEWKLESGTPLRLKVKTGMPWHGETEIAVEPGKAEEFTVFLRIPGWSLSTKAEVNGEGISNVKPGEYLAIRRRWRAGDRVRIVFDLTPRRVFANPRVSEDYGKAALQRGPIVYCLEKHDNPDVDVFEVALDGGAPLETEAATGALAGAVLLKTQGLAYEGPLGRRPLYEFQPAVPARRVPLVFVPYFAFHDRGPADFTVWLPCRGCGF